MPANANKNRTILITGATGKQGGAALRHLRQRGFPVRAMTRNPDEPKARRLVGPGIEVVRGDFNDPASLRKALDGVYGVFSVQEPWGAGGVEAETRQGIALADAARGQRISHFVYTSVGSADQNTGIPHFDSKFKIEEHLRGLGIPYTILRPVFFMENWLMRKQSIAEGVLAGPLTPDRKLQQIAVDDIGGIAAAVFEKPGRWQGRAIELAGDDLSGDEVAAAFARLLGHEVRYRQVPWDQFEQQVGHEHTVMFRWFEDVGYHADIAAVRQEYPGLTGFEKWARGQKWEAAGGAGGR